MGKATDEQPISREEFNQYRGLVADEIERLHAHINKMHELHAATITRIDALLVHFKREVAVIMSEQRDSDEPQQRMN